MTEHSLTVEYQLKCRDDEIANLKRENQDLRDKLKEAEQDQEFAEAVKQAIKASPEMQQFLSNVLRSCANENNAST
jgi:phage shock protein A